jgi:hypothetical protein
LLESQYPPLMSERVLRLAARGLSDRKPLSLDEVHELCGCVLEHIAQHKVMRPLPLRLHQLKSVLAKLVPVPERKSLRPPPTLDDGPHPIGGGVTVGPTRGFDLADAT